MTTNDEARESVWPTVAPVPVEELARQQGVRPIGSVDELARADTFESDAELDEFLTDLYLSRRTGSA